MDIFNQCLYYGKNLIIPGIFVTLRMVVATMVIGFTFGFILAILLTMYGPHGLNHKKHFYKVLSFIINTIRSFPILILIVAISPFTRMVVGTTIGEKAAVLPLSISAIAFIARLLEGNFIQVDKQLIEAARSYGATNLQIMFRVIIRESIPSIISVITMATSYIYCSNNHSWSSTELGRLGAISLTYGYQSFNDVVLYMSVAVLFILVSIVQFIGERLYKKIL